MQRIFVIVLFLSSMLFTTSLRRISASHTKGLATRKCIPLQAVQKMNVEEFANILNGDLREQYQIIDVREPNELDMVSIKGSDIINLPLSQAGDWSTKVEQGKMLDETKPTLCLCHHGMRSMRVATFLDGKGFQAVFNIEGGIHQYAVKVDPTIGTY